MSNTTNPLRDKLMRVLYNHADATGEDTPWFSDELWDKITSTIEFHYKKQEEECRRYRMALEKIPNSNSDARGWYYSCEIVDEICKEALFPHKP